jgi:hypothetical protein
MVNCVEFITESVLMVTENGTSDGLGKPALTTPTAPPSLQAPRNEQPAVSTTSAGVPM